MKTRWSAATGLLALWVLYGSASWAGPNAGARARLNWGPHFQDSLTSITIPPGVDTTVTFYVSITGLKELRGIDVQLAVLGGGEGDRPTALPPAWQFQSGAPCDNENNVVVTPHFPGCAVTGIQGLVTALDGVYSGTLDRFPVFNQMTFIALTAACAAAVPRDPDIRYGVLKATFTVQGSRCPGIEKPVCIRPTLRLGHDHDRGPMMGLVDQALQYDFIAFEPGYDRLTINPGKGGCPSPSPAPASVWGRTHTVKH